MNIDNEISMRYNMFVLFKAFNTYLKNINFALEME